jgi:hypothetical protein
VTSQSTDGSIRDFLSEETERIIDDLSKSKMKVSARILVTVIRALENKYGPGVLEVARDAVLRRQPRPQSQLGKPEEDLYSLRDNLDKDA